MNPQPAAPPEVLIAGDFFFPEGTAPSNIVRGHCRALRSAGLSVGLLPNQTEGRAEDLNGEGGYVFQGSRYWPVRRAHSQLHRVLSTLFAWDDDRLEWLRGMESLAGVKAIILYSGESRTVPLLLRLRRFCRANGIRLYNIAVEWHERRRFGHAGWTVRAVDAEVQRRCVNPILDGMICISEYFQNYYNSKSCRTILIPPLLDFSDPRWSASDQVPQLDYGKEVTILFSGSPDRERHDIILRAVLEARRQGAPVVMEYVGCDRNQLAAIGGVGEQLLGELGQGIRFHGRVPFAEMARIYGRSRGPAFGILMREDSRWSRACFPSKVPEFLALGVPLICNLTSDLGRYLKHGQNALVVDHLSSNALLPALMDAARMPAERYAGMKAAATATARLFDATKFAGEYRQFILSNS